MKTRTCYMCDAPETSVEHVPPRCLFPEQKDLPPGVDLRKQLITVPSCEEHNSRKSKDDEYLLYALLLNVPNNETAKNHVFTKLIRAIEYNPHLITQFAKTQVPVVVEDSVSGKIEPTVAVQVDERRLTSGLEMMGRAIYFHHFNQRWRGEVCAYPNFILAITEPNAQELNAPVEQMAAHAGQLMQGEPRFGENQQVFSYQVKGGQAPVETIMLLRFYEGSRVTLLFKASPD
jgi:hypothetical protein